MSKAFELAKKLKALADRGVDGEARSAEQLLAAHLKKHGISLAELEEGHVFERVFSFKKWATDQQRFFRQVVSSVMQRDYAIKEFTAYGKKLRNLKQVDVAYFIELTDIEYLEIDARMSFFWPHYCKQLEAFYSAYIQKQELFAHQLNPKTTVSTNEKMSDEELSFYSAIKKSTIQKRLQE